MSTVEFLDTARVDPLILDSFLRQVYSPAHCDFLRNHGGWWHHSNINRIVAQVDNQIAGYCSVIPTNIWVAGHVRPALWWVDLIISPQFRGRGLQSLLDQYVRSLANLILGFPNKLASHIHRKHGWGVREDTRILLLPLFPSQVRMVQNAGKLGGELIRMGARVLDPFASSWGKWITSVRTKHTLRCSSIDVNGFARIFQSNVGDTLNTTWRDEDYFDWRYCKAPRPAEYTYYISDTRKSSLYLIARHVTRPPLFNGTRILDLFGDFNDTVAIRELLTLAIKDAIHHGSCQVTLISSNPMVQAVARWLGFVFSKKICFCWWSTDLKLMEVFNGDNYWTMSDSDNDAPD